MSNRFKRRGRVRRSPDVSSLGTHRSTGGCRQGRGLDNPPLHHCTSGIRCTVYIALYNAVLIIRISTSEDTRFDLRSYNYSLSVGEASEWPDTPWETILSGINGATGKPLPLFC